jgi:hypothetical protein
MMSSFISGLGGIALFVVMSPMLQLLARRTAPRISPVIVLAIAFLMAHVITTVLGGALVHPFRYWNAASLFGFGVMSYIYIFGGVYKSISLRILLDLVRRPNYTIEFSDISDRQVPEIFVERSSILIADGLVVQDDGRFMVTSAGRRLAARVARIRRLFAIGDSGLYDFDRTLHETRG